MCASLVDMTKLKERIPTEDVLRENISKLVPEITAEIRESVGPLEAEYILFRNRIRKWIGIGVTILVIFYLSPHILSYLGTLFPILASLGFVAVSVYALLILFVLVKVPAGWRLIKAGIAVSRRFNNGVNKVIFNKVLVLLGLSSVVFASKEEGSAPPLASGNLKSIFSSLANTSSEAATALSLLSESELITEPHNTNTVGDLTTATYGDSQISFAELYIRHETGSGKNRSVRNIFKGYLVAYDLDRTLTGKTFISTEGDTSGWGHKSFWGSLKDGGVKETQLEWPEFENLLHVATTDGAEARYVLTTDFMQDLHEWWKKEKGNIRLSFIGKRMYILFPDNQVQLSGTIGKIEEKQVLEYSYAVARPLLHVMHLVEDVRL